MQSVPPHSLLDQLARAGHLAPPVSASRLTGGRTNTVWKLHDQSRVLVLKQYLTGGRNILFPNDPDAERTCLRHLAGTALAPHLIAAGQSADGSWSLYTHVSGQPWSRDAALAGSHLRKLHAQTQPVGLRAAPNGSDALCRQTLDLLALTDGPVADALRRAQPTGPHIPPGGTALIHGDPVPGNLIVDGPAMCFIDWQCPAIGDPCDDLAIFLSPAMQQLYRGSPLTTEDAADALTAYGAPDIVSRYHRLAPWFHWRMAAYCLWRLQQGDPEYAQGLDLERAAIAA